jgi:hypothetical protein
VKSRGSQNTRRWISISTIAFVVAGLLIFIAACDKKAPASFERPPAPVAVMPAVARDVPVYLDEIGKFVAR